MLSPRWRILALGVAVAVAVGGTGWWLADRVNAPHQPPLRHDMGADVPPKVERLTLGEASERLRGTFPDDTMVFTFQGAMDTPYHGSLGLARWGDGAPSVVPESQNFVGTPRIVGVSSAEAPLAIQTQSGTMLVDATTLRPSVVALDQTRGALLQWAVPSLDALVTLGTADDAVTAEVSLGGEPFERVATGGWFEPTPTGEWILSLPGALVEAGDYAVLDLTGNVVLSFSTAQPPLYVWGGTGMAVIEQVGDQQRAVIYDLTTGERAYESSPSDVVELPQAERSWGITGEAALVYASDNSGVATIWRIAASGDVDALAQGLSADLPAFFGDTEHLVFTARWQEDAYLLQPGEEPRRLGVAAWCPPGCDGSRLVVQRDDGAFVSLVDGAEVPLALPPGAWPDWGDGLWSENGEWLWTTYHTEVSRDPLTYVESVVAVNLLTGEVTVPIRDASRVDMARLAADGTGLLVWVAATAEDSAMALDLAWSSGEVEEVSPPNPHELGRGSPAFFSPDQDAVVFDFRKEGNKSDVWVYQIGSGAEPTVLVEDAWLWRTGWSDAAPHGLRRYPRL